MRPSFLSRIAARLHRSGGRLAASRRGATLPMMAAGMIPVLAAIGSAVDIGRVYMARLQMQAGVDAAALAGARAFAVTGAHRPDSREAQVSAYFLANFPLGYLGTGTVAPEADFRTTNGINITEVSAATPLPMMFMRIFGIPTWDIAASAVAELQPRPIEVMVVLDDTGSMQTTLSGEGRSRMSALKTAMHDFVDVLHQGANQRDELALGFVTYTVTTNVGKILRDNGVAIREIDGYTNVGIYTGGGSDYAANPLGWKGCVENDDSVPGIGANVSVFENGAYDIDRILPGENGRPGARPFLFPPSATTNSVRATPTASSLSGAYATGARLPLHYRAAHNNTTTGDGRRNNLYRLDGGSGDPAIAQALANSAAYRQHFHDFYIGLNHDRSNDLDDVIVRAADGGYYTPGSAVAWRVEYGRIPFIADTTDWAQPNANYGYPTRAGFNLRMPSPNWQCPNPSMDVQYGRPKSVYRNYIDYDNHPLMPASGTLHHIGMLWGYRLLTRDDVFRRTNPVPSERPMRALVFMTDGETAADGSIGWYGAYGRLAERRISSDATNVNTFRQQVMRRFAKVCESAKRDDINVYIVSLLPAPGDTQGIFRACAGSNYLETSTTAEIRSAFQQIAVDLVDLHLTR